MQLQPYLEGKKNHKENQTKTQAKQNNEKTENQSNTFQHSNNTAFTAVNIELNLLYKAVPTF